MSENFLVQFDQAKIPLEDFLWFAGGDALLDCHVDVDVALPTAVTWYKDNQVKNIRATIILDANDFL